MNQFWLTYGAFNIYAITMAATNQGQQPDIESPAFQEALQQLRALDYPIPWSLVIRADNPTTSVAQILSLLREHPASGFRPLDGRDGFIKYVHTIRVPTKHQCLGFITLDRNEMNVVSQLTARYSEIERARSCRGQGTSSSLSAYDAWSGAEKDAIIKAGIENLLGPGKAYATGVLFPDLIEQCSNVISRTYWMSAYFPGELVTNVCQRLFGHASVSPSAPPIKMLDISAGWGDRLIAAISLGYSYTACDPNTRMAPIYARIIGDLAGVSRSAQTAPTSSERPANASYRVLPVPFEDWKPDPSEFQTYDILFTSPPFFDFEIYSKEPTQSIVRYPTLDTWINKFMMQSLHTAHRLLKLGAYVVLHLEDIIMASHPIVFVNQIIDYCVKCLHWIFIGKFIYTIRDPKKREVQKNQSNTILNQKSDPSGSNRTIGRFDKNGLRTDATGNVLVQTLWVFTVPK